MPGLMKKRGRQTTKSTRSGTGDSGDESDLGVIGSVQEVLKMTNQVRRNRRIQFREKHRQNIEASQSLADKEFESYKERLLRRHDERIRKLSKLIDKKASLETRIIESTLTVEGTYKAIVDEISTILKGRLTELDIAEVPQE